MNKLIKLLALLVIPFILNGSYFTFQVPTIILMVIVLYGLIDFKYPLFFLPSLFLINDLRTISLLLIVIGLSTILRHFYTKNKYYSFLYLGLILGFSGSYTYLMDKELLNTILILSFLSLSIYFIIIKYVTIYYVNNSNVSKFLNIKMVQSLFCILLSLSAIGLPLYFFYAIEILIILYLSRLNYNGFSLILSILTFLLTSYYKVYNIPIIFLIIGILYMLPKYYPIFISGILLLLDYFFFKNLDTYILIETSSLLIGFELFKLIDLEYFEKKSTILNMYDNVINNFNDQVLKFASFLDEFERKFISDRETKINYNQSYNYLVSSFCQSCPKKSVCYPHKKNEVYLFLKSSLLYGNNLMIKRDPSLTLDFIKGCNYHEAIINKANMLKNKFNFDKNRTKSEQALEHQLVGISNTLRQYVIDISSKREMHLELFLEFKHSLVQNGYKILLFNVRRIFRNDFWIEIGLSNITIEELNSIVKSDAEKRFNSKVSIEIRKQSDDCIYFSIIPFIAINVLYGHGSITKDDLNIGGDNYMVKDLDTGLFIAAISDGMGSGYNAYTESKETLNLIDKITEFEVNPNTSINMLNTFYSLKENMDQYATLDFLEINKSTKEAILFKMGSSNTYLVRDSNVSVIYNQNLPFGISDLITKEELTLKEKDCIILASDGISDNIEMNELEQTILLSLHKDPQTMAYDILNKIISKEKKALDDMSIVVLKIEKSAA